VTVLALATLGDATQIDLDFCQSGQGKYKCVTVVCHCLQRCSDTFANVNMTFKTVVDVSMTVYEASSGLYYKDITIVTMKIDAQNCGISFIKL
jgi:hypothetical protein